MPREKKAAKTNGNGANLGFEATLWAAADKLRNNMDAAEARTWITHSVEKHRCPK